MGSEPPSKDKVAERELKLAQALRANLRRRKTPPPSVPTKPGQSA